MKVQISFRGQIKAKSRCINFRRFKLGKDGLKSKNARKETPIIFKFYVKNMSGMLVMVNWEASYGGGEKKQLKIFHLESLTV